MAAIAALFLLASCGNPQTVEEAYLEQLYDLAPSLSIYPPDQLIDLGPTICDAFDNGYTLENAVWEIDNIVDGLPVTTHEAGVIVGTAIETYCPNHRDLIEPWLYEENPGFIWDRIP